MSTSLVSMACAAGVRAEQREARHAEPFGKRFPVLPERLSRTSSRFMRSLYEVADGPGVPAMAWTCQGWGQFDLLLRKSLKAVGKPLRREYVVGTDDRCSQLDALR